MDRERDGERDRETERRTERETDTQVNRSMASGVPPKGKSTTARLASVYYRVPGNQKICFTTTETIDKQVNK